MRLIDADVLTERLNNAIECGRRVDMPTLELEAVLVDVQNAPSIDIVFCKVCIWRDKDNQGEVYCTYVKGLADINGDSFCSWGERSE